MSQSNQSPYSVAAESLAVGLAAAILYIALRQDVIYSMDGVFLTSMHDQGDLKHVRYWIYLPLLSVVASLVEPLGCDTHAAGGVLSALTTAVGVGLAHHASRVLGLARAAALATTLLVAVAPAVLFFATVVEVHSVFFGFAGWAFLRAARFVVRPGASAAAWLGVATGLSFAAHASAAMLPGVLFPFAFVLARERGGRARALLGWLALAAIAHATALVVIPRLFAWLGFPATAVPAYAQFVRFENLAFFGRSFVRDWLVPFVPLSAVVVAGLFVPRQRRLSGWLLAAVLGYVAVAALILGKVTEHGAYQLPLAWPVAVLATRVLGRGAWLAAAVSAAVALGSVHSFENRPEPLEFARGYREAIGERPAFLFVGQHHEIEAVLLHVRPAGYRILQTELTMAPAELAAALPFLDQFIANEIAAGREVLLCAGAQWLLANGESRGHGAAGPRMLAHLRETFAWEPVSAAGFAAQRLSLR